MTEPGGSLLSFAGKAALITGGSHGIGQGCARVFVEAGAAVVIGDRDEAAGEALAAELTAAGPGRCDFTRCEMSKPEARTPPPFAPTWKAGSGWAARAHPKRSVMPSCSWPAPRPSSSPGSS